jgi:hypothetical protein
LLACFGACRLKRKAAAPAAFLTTSRLQQDAADLTFERFETFETDLDRGIKAVKGTHTRRGKAHAAKPAAAT